MTINNDNKAERIAAWIASDNIGISSKTMLCHSLGATYKWQSPPQDPSDFNRCRQLLKYCPWVRDSFDEIAKISKQWKAIIDNWEKIENCFISECGDNWNKGSVGIKTHELMCKIFESVRQ